MILMSQIFDVTANENARYKRNELECDFVGLLHHPFWLNLVLALLDITFRLFKLLCLAKDNWRGFSTRNTHMVQFVIWIWLKMVNIS